jgi:hypothetical protein
MGCPLLIYELIFYFCKLNIYIRSQTCESHNALFSRLASGCAHANQPERKNHGGGSRCHP